MGIFGNLCVGNDHMMMGIKLKPLTCKHMFVCWTNVPDCQVLCTSFILTNEIFLFRDKGIERKMVKGEYMQIGLAREKKAKNIHLK